MNSPFFLRKLCRWLPVFAWAFCSTLTTKADALRWNRQPDGTLALSYPARDQSYYVLYRGDAVTGITTPISISLGEVPWANFVDPLPVTAAVFYQVREIPIQAPSDVDGDGMDDFFELLQHSRNRTRWP